MQTKIASRIVRTIALGLGFVFFLMLTYTAAGQANDPRYVAGQPSMFDMPSIGNKDPLGFNLTEQSYATANAAQTTVLATPAHTHMSSSAEKSEKVTNVAESPVTPTTIKPVTSTSSQALEHTIHGKPQNVK